MPSAKLSWAWKDQPAKCQPLWAWQASLQRPAAASSCRSATRHGRRQASAIAACTSPPTVTCCLTYFLSKCSVLLHPAWISPARHFYDAGSSASGLRSQDSTTLSRLWWSRTRARHQQSHPLVRTDHFPLHLPFPPLHPSIFSDPNIGLWFWF